MTKYKVAIIGLGVGEAHIAGYAKNEHCEVVAICDSNLEKLREVSSRHPSLDCYLNANEVLENSAIDIVSIATYDDVHFEQIMLGLENNKHLFVEKPLCIREDHAWALFKALQNKKHIKISSNLILRLTPRFVKLKELIEKDYFGEIYSIEGDYNYGRLHKIVESWRGNIQGYSGVFGGGIHIVDLYYWLLGKKPVEVTAYGNKICTKNSQYTNFDFVTALLRYEDGLISKITINLGSVSNHFHKLVMYGTKAMFENKSHNIAELTNRVAGEIITESFDYEYPGVNKGDMIDSFVQSIVTDSEPLVHLEELFDVMAICFAIEKAVHTGEKTVINYFT
jgi:predicted dehydrogenase